MVVTAPHPASRAAIARPMPWVEPLTKAVRPVRSIFIGYLACSDRGLVLGETVDHHNNMPRVLAKHVARQIGRTAEGLERPLTVSA